MFLSDLKIKECLKSKKIVIEPAVKESNIRSAGVRVHLAEEILIAEPGQIVDLGNPSQIKYKKVDLSKKSCILKPGDFILAGTKEKLQLSRDLIAFIDGRSTIARLGLTVHLASTTMDGHYDEPRSVTLEIANVGNLSIKLVAGYPIGMFIFSRLDGEVEQKVQNQYKGQRKATPPNLELKTGKDL